MCPVLTDSTCVKLGFHPEVRGSRDPYGVYDLMISYASGRQLPAFLHLE